MTVEIAGAPISRHDLDVIRTQLLRVREQGGEPVKVIVSSRRIIMASGLRAYGVSIAVNDNYGLNDGAIIVLDSAPVPFDFEELE